MKEFSLPCAGAGNLIRSTPVLLGSRHWASLRPCQQSTPAKVGSNGSAFC